MIKEDFVARRKRGRSIGGIILILIGTALLLQRLDLDIPGWVFSWQMILIVIGLALGFKHNFRGGPWFAMMAVGGIFLAGEILHWPYNTAKFIWPVVLIAIGITALFKRHNEHMFKDTRYFASDITDGDISADDDTINISSCFSGLEKVVTSKNFKGGYVSNVFGGTDLNLMQADINGTVTLEVTAIFGGCEIVVPANWMVKVDISTIMGGVEEKRPSALLGSIDKDKVLLLKGSCIFGGVEIKSFA